VRTSGQSLYRAPPMIEANPYDEIRYSSYPYAQTHPDRMATIAGLYGLSVPDSREARVLELGCGGGGNLIAMAAATPGIRGVGVDLAASPIAEAREMVEAVGLTNVEFHQADLTDLVDGRLGEFDYVIAHGVYAWVPDDVRDALLATCHAHLAADGLAYVSYNANPGGYVRRIMRDAGLWFAGKTEDPVEQAERAKDLYRLLQFRSTGTDWWAGLLAGTIEQFAEGPTYRLVHDDLSAHWNPVWFADFAARAARHGLAYVGDADLTNVLPYRLPADVEPVLAALSEGDRIRREQIFDLMRCVFFRQSVLTRDSRRTEETIQPDAMRRLYFAARPGAEDRPAGLLGSAVDLLRARLPDTLGFDEIRAAVGAEPDAVAAALLEGFNSELLMPHAAPLMAVAPGDQPLASPLARWQAQRQTEVTSLAYASVHMEEPAARLLLTLLDGTRDRAAIRAEFSSRTGVRLSAEDLDANLTALGRLFLIAG
jgi:SAM-dependent methyltransferase